MRFNSLAFFWFFVVVATIYWLWANRRIGRRNVYLVAVSYFFYACWDYRFLTLLVASSTVDFVVAKRIEASASPRLRRRWLTLSIVANLGCLGFFKYFDFFAGSAVDLADSIGWKLQAVELQIILPLGISFYTLQTLGYTIDVYRRQVPACRQWHVFFAYVCFFPQLVAGPIERSGNLLPQFARHSRVRIERVPDALRWVLWGLFQKVVIADGLATLVDPVYADLGSQTGSTIAYASLFFAFQIYGDFAGYSLMAIGLAELLGFELMTNFRQPYFATSVSDFWRRWHISLSTWFRDYVYIPLGGNRRGLSRQLLNLWIVFTISGLWHGAAWSFVVWGWLHFLLIATEVLLLHGCRRVSLPRRAGRCAGGLLTFATVTFAWLFFRATDIHQAIAAAGRLFSSDILLAPEMSRIGLLGIAVMVAADAFSAAPGLRWNRIPAAVRWTLYLVMALACLANLDNASTFIYFQF